MYCILSLEQSQMAAIAKISCPCSRQEELYVSLLSEKQESSQKISSYFIIQKQISRPSIGSRKLMGLLQKKMIDVTDAYLFWHKIGTVSS